MGRQDYLIELDGAPAGRLFSFSGGVPKGDVVSIADGDGARKQKHIVGVRYQDILLKCGTGMSQNFYNWVGTSFGASVERKHGAIIKLDQNQNVTGRLEFQDAVVNELKLPELNGGSNAEAFLFISISPEFTTTKAASGKPDLGVYVSEQSAKWNVGGFRMSINGFKTGLDNISKIGSMTLGRTISDDYSTGGRRPEKIVGKTSYPNIKISVPELYGDDFFSWFEDFVINGNNADMNEKKGSIEYLGPTGGKPFFVLDLENLGIFELATESPLRTKSMAPVQVSLYAERMTFSAGSSAIK